MPTAFDFWTSFCSGLLGAVYPDQCPLCDRIGLPAPCPECREGFVALPENRRERQEPGPLDFQIALYAYTGRAGQAVRRLKYERRTALTPYLSGLINQEIRDRGLDPDWIVPVPIHWSRRCSRGFNQAELLLDQTPHRSDLLLRVRRTQPQVGLSANERLKNLEGAFQASPEVSGRRILLVDDVLTSGQTARECAIALRTAGATEVGILALCGEGV